MSKEAVAAAASEAGSEPPPLEMGITPSSLKVPTEEIKQRLSEYNSQRPAGPKDAEWQLYYWPSLLGRGEYVRLLFAQAGVEWFEPAKVRDAKGKNDYTSILQFIRGEQAKELPPVFAPPIIRKGDFILAETGAILEYLGAKYGMAGSTPEERARIAMLTQSALDFIAQGRLCFHSLPDKTASYYTQIKETRPQFEYFRNKRVPRFLSSFQRCLVFNKGGDGFLVGDKISFADITMYHALWVTEQQCPEAYAKCDVPKLKAFQQRIGNLPKIKAYLNSERRGKFNGDSFM